MNKLIKLTKPSKNAITFADVLDAESKAINGYIKALPKYERANARRKFATREWTISTPIWTRVFPKPKATKPPTYGVQE